MRGYQNLPRFRQLNFQCSFVNNICELQPYLFIPSSKKRGFFTKKLNFLYILTYLFICQSQRDRHYLETLYRNVRAYARARARVCMRVNIIRIFRFLFFRKTVFWDFLKKAVLKQDCNNAKFFRLFLSYKWFIKLSIILHKQDFTRRRRISSPRDFTTT